MAQCWALAGGPRGSVPSASRRRCWGRSEHADRSAEPMGPKMWRVTVNDWERHKETQRRKMRASYNNNEETWQINKSQQSPLILRKFTGIKWGRLYDLQANSPHTCHHPTPTHMYSLTGFHWFYCFQMFYFGLFTLYPLNPSTKGLLIISVIFSIVLNWKWRTVIKTRRSFDDDSKCKFGFWVTEMVYCFLFQETMTRQILQKWT